MDTEHENDKRCNFRKTQLTDWCLQSLLYSSRPSGTGMCVYRYGRLTAPSTKQVVMNPVCGTLLAQLLR